jgi:predicted PurR-regulated permease PerM
MSTIRRFARYTAIVAGALLGLALLWRVREPLLVFVLSLVLAAAFRLPIDTLVRRGLPRGAALAITYVLTLGIVGVLIYLIGIPLAWDLGDASSYLARAYEQALERWPQSPSVFLQTVAEQLPPAPLLYRMLAGEQGSVMLQGVMGFAGNIANVLSDLSLALVISVYWSADQVRFERLLLSLVPVTNRSHVRDAWHDVETRVGAYLRAEVFLVILGTGLLWAGFRLMQLPYPALLALFAALARLVPWVGIPVALIPPLLIGSINTPTLGIVAAIITLMVLLVLEQGIKRRFFPQREYSSLLIGLTVIAMTYTSGLGGAILAPLLAITTQLIGGHLLDLRNAPAPQPARNTLKTQLIKLRTQLTRDEETVRPEIQSLLERLDSLVAASEEYMRKS